MSKFKIPAIPSTTPKCIRLPNDLIEEVEKKIEKRDCTFTAFVIEAIKYALNDLDQ